MTPAEQMRVVDDLRLLMARVQRLQRELSQATGELNAAIAKARALALEGTDR